VTERLAVPLDMFPRKAVLATLTCTDQPPGTVLDPAGASVLRGNVVVGRATLVPLQLVDEIQVPPTQAVSVRLALLSPTDVAVAVTW
jgi:hypothetical protein